MVCFDLTVLAVVLASFAVTIEGKPEKLIEVEKDVRFDLFTLKNPSEPQILLINDTQSFEKSNFDREIPTRIFIHGFQSKGELKESMTNAFLLEGQRNVNLIAINWEKASLTINYPAAAGHYVEQIGMYTAEMVDFMVSEKLLKLSDNRLVDLTVIGFSLGAHVAGFVGKNVRSGKLPKIYGLDPASPLFSIDKPDRRLHSEDALYVETIHTSKLGFFEPIGHVAFYPNGGRSQPGCSWDFSGKCSHQCAYKYFAESVSFDQPLIGQLCESLEDVKNGKCRDSDVIMGGEPGPSKQSDGLYYIAITAD